MRATEEVVQQHIAKLQTFRVQNGQDDGRPPAQQSLQLGFGRLIAHENGLLGAKVNAVIRVATKQLCQCGR
jgi:hypothetical protein